MSAALCNSVYVTMPHQNCCFSTNAIVSHAMGIGQAMSTTYATELAQRNLISFVDPMCTSNIPMCTYVPIMCTNNIPMCTNVYQCVPMCTNAMCTNMYQCTNVYQCLPMTLAMCTCVPMQKSFPAEHCRELL